MTKVRADEARFSFEECRSNVFKHTSGEKYISAKRVESADPWGEIFGLAKYLSRWMKMEFTAEKLPEENHKVWQFSDRSQAI